MVCLRYEPPLMSCSMHLNKMSIKCLISSWIENSHSACCISLIFSKLNIGCPTNSPDAAPPPDACAQWLNAIYGLEPCDCCNVWYPRKTILKLKYRGISPITYFSVAQSFCHFTQKYIVNNRLISYYKTSYHDAYYNGGIGWCNFHTSFGVAKKFGSSSGASNAAKFQSNIRI